jgi:16S rRNA (guanine527-N7)-methyltransferase
MKKPLPPYNPSRMEEALRAGCDACGVRLGTHAATQLDAYARLLRDGSTRMNLTAILDDRGIGVRHFADSLSVLPLLLEEAAGASGRPEPFSVLDVGSGAGLPGIPLRIALDELALAKREEDAADPAGGTSVVPAGSDSRPAPPRIRITLLDALAKRVGFLEEVIRTLDLSDIEALHARAEDAAHGPLRERFDFVVARAVAPLNVLLEYGLPYVRVGGLFVAMKGPDPADETAAAARAVSLLGGRMEPLRTLELPDPEGGAASRTLVPVRKQKPCPKSWPRQAGKPEKAPIL